MATDAKKQLRRAFKYMETAAIINAADEGRFTLEAGYFSQYQFVQNLGCDQAALDRLDPLQITIWYEPTLTEIATKSLRDMVLNNLKVEPEKKTEQARAMAAALRRLADDIEAKTTALHDQPIDTLMGPDGKHTI